jgi:hypothetical protein
MGVREQKRLNTTALGNHGNYSNQVVSEKNDVKALLSLGIKDLWIF